MASGSYVNDSNEELASKTSEQLSAIKSDDENVSDVGDPLESLESVLYLLIYQFYLILFQLY